MDNTPAGSDSRIPGKTGRRIAWLPIPFFLVLFAIAPWIYPDSSFEPRLLLPILNLVFITGVCVLVAALAAASYAMGGSVAVLLLGCGTLALAAGSAVTGGGVLFALEPNATVSVASLTSALSSICFLASAVVAVTATRPRRSDSAPLRRIPVMAYAAIILMVAVLTAAGPNAIVPWFASAAGGYTVTRQIVLGSAVACVALAAALFRLQVRREPSRFIHWYSLSLLLFAVGLGGFIGQRAMGSLLGWTARGALYVGCIYLFVAVLSLPRGTRSWRISLDHNLRETERRHRSLVDFCPDAILVHADGKYVFANPAAARLFGAASPDAVVGSDVLALVHPDHRSLGAERMERAYAGQPTALQEMRWLRLDGSEIDVEVTGAPVQFRGTPAVQVVVRDVSARKRAEAALRLQSNMAVDLLSAGDMQAICDLLADRIYSVAAGAMVSVSEFDPRGHRITVRSVRCTDIEREVARGAFGRDPEGLSLPFPDETGDRWRPGELAPVPGGLSDVLFKQIPQHVCDHLAQVIGIGDIFGMACAYEDDILGTVAILTRGRGPLAQQKVIESLVASAALAMKRARTDEERADLAKNLRASEGLLRAVTDHTTDAVYVKDTESRWLMANPALLRIVGRPAEEVLGLTDKEIYSDPKIGEAILANDRQVLASGEPSAFEEAAETPQGVRWFLSTKAPMRDVTGHISGLIGISRDITERRHMEEALRETDRRKNQFIAMLSHELRNPLAPIRYALPLIRRAPLTEQAAGALAILSRQVDHLVRLVDDLLDVSRITHGQIELRRQAVTLQAVVGAAVESAAPLVEMARHTLRVQLPEADVWLNVDPDRVSQVFTNLLTNAAKYTPPGGDIALEAVTENGEAVIRVRDNGIGIPPEAMPTLFTMFYQVDRPDRFQEGLGIGLSLAKQLTEMHAGTIEACSPGIGAGAEFIVRLPVAAAPVEEPRAQTTAVPAAGRPLRILVVDDNADLVEMLAIVIGDLGHEVRKAFDGRGALSVAKLYRPDVVLLDLGLPGLSGFQVATELRRDPGLAGTRLVALTGLGQVEDQRRTRDAGFDYHLTKPTQPDDLERLLAQFAAAT